MSKINSYIFSSLKKFLRDNGVKYSIYKDGLTVYSAQKFPQLAFQMEVDNMVAVHTMEFFTGTHRFKASNIYALLSNLVELKILSGLEGYYVRGIHGIGRPPKKLKPKIIQLYGRNGNLFENDSPGKGEVI